MSWDTVVLFLREVELTYEVLMLPHCQKELFRPRVLGPSKRVVAYKA